MSQNENELQAENLLKIRGLIEKNDRGHHSHKGKEHDVDTTRCVWVSYEVVCDSAPKGCQGAVAVHTGRR